ncbi:hypothetical protein ACFLVC_01570 [Chloroflexota bacterium]
MKSGAYLLDVIWGAGNNVWWSLLLFIPFFDIVWIFVMGVKGSEWAWQSKRWISIELGLFNMLSENYTGVEICGKTRIQTVLSENTQRKNGAAEVLTDCPMAIFYFVE